MQSESELRGARRPARRPSSAIRGAGSAARPARSIRGKPRHVQALYLLDWIECVDAAREEMENESEELSMVLRRAKRTGGSARRGPTYPADQRRGEFSGRS